MWAQKGIIHSTALFEEFLSVTVSVIKDKRNCRNELLAYQVSITTSAYYYMLILLLLFKKCHLISCMHFKTTQNIAEHAFFLLLNKAEPKLK